MTATENAIMAAVVAWQDDHPQRRVRTALQDFCHLLNGWVARSRMSAPIR